MRRELCLRVLPATADKIDELAEAGGFGPGCAAGLILDLALGRADGVEAVLAAWKAAGIGLAHTDDTGIERTWGFDRLVKEGANG